MAYQLKIWKAVYKGDGGLNSRDIKLFKNENISERTIHLTIKDVKDTVPCQNTLKVVNQKSAKMRRN